MSEITTPLTERIRAFVGQLTTDEKVQLLSRELRGSGSARARRRPEVLIRPQMK